MLDRLVSRAVFSVAHGVVREHEDGGQFHQRREPDRRPRVVAEDKKVAPKARFWITKARSIAAIACSRTPKCRFFHRESQVEYLQRL